jgi:hypothetical protein
MKQNDSFVLDEPISEMYLHWTAQPGRTITLAIFTSAQFNSGSQISVTGGGVSLVEGSSFTQSVQTLVAATALEIFPTDTTRKLGTFQNNTGSNVWVGPSTVTNAGASLGYQVAPGASFQWRNTSNIYAYSVLGGNILVMTEM